ncbi:MAG: hypothetical protein GKR94_06090 [Gammaproteobacteria bacterium]|nr:hypothetical protein [Gammaproteobacteria bacterium]
MIKKIVIYFSLIFSVSVLAEADRAAVAQELSGMAKKAEVRLGFSVDPNDDTTLMLHRVSTLKPSELSGDWTFYLFSIDSSPDYLKKKGFNKVRIYTSQSKGINDYALKIL